MLYFTILCGFVLYCAVWYNVVKCLSVGGAECLWLKNRIGMAWHAFWAFQHDKDRFCFCTEKMDFIFPPMCLLVVVPYSSATYCAELNHTLYCGSQYHTPCTVVHITMLLHTTLYVLSCTLVHIAVSFCTVSYYIYCTILYCTVLYCCRSAILLHIPLYLTALYHTLLFHTLLCCTILQITTHYLYVLYHVLQCLALYCTIPCSAVWYRTVLQHTL